MNSSPPESGKPPIPSPTSTKEVERRRELRVPLRVLKIQGERKGEVFFGYAGNLSTTGLFIQTTNPREAGMQVKVTFQLPNTKKNIECLTEVMWGRNYLGKDGPPPGMGLRFIDVSTEDSDAIRTFVEEESN